MNKKLIEKTLNGYNFSDFQWINPQDIKVSQWVRMKCTFGCGDFGSGTCPPNVPSVEECKTFLNEYSNAVIIRLSKHADKNAYPSDWSKETTKELLEIERLVFLMNYPKTFLLTLTR